MALIVEDGTGLDDSESYATIEFADKYNEDRGREVFWGSLDDDAKAHALRKATDYIQSAYRGRWPGYRVYEDQSLDWPRTGATLDGRVISITTIPRELMQATAELAYRAAQGTELAPDLTPTVKRKKIGPIEVEYTPQGASRSAFQYVELLLGPLLATNSGASRWAVPMIRG